MTRAAIQAALGLKARANFEERYLKPALADNLIEMTIPDKPRSSEQKYRLTKKDPQFLNGIEGSAKEGELCPLRKKNNTIRSKP